MGHKNFHTDVEFARNLGLPNAIAQGMMSGCYVSELMTRFFGWGWRRGGRMSVYFINAVFAGDTLYVSGAVKEKVPEGDATRVVLDVWCENQSGKKTTVGTASGLVYKSE
jgi:acyl dehydratase